MSFTDQAELVAPRGNFFVFTVSFVDANGNPTSPTSANLYVSSVVNGTRTLSTVAMSATANPTIWTGVWNSEGADPSSVDWSVKAVSSPGFYIVQDGLLDITANQANQP